MILFPSIFFPKKNKIFIFRYEIIVKFLHVPIIIFFLELHMIKQWIIQWNASSIQMYSWDQDCKCHVFILSQLFVAVPFAPFTCSLPIEKWTSLREIRQKMWTSLIENLAIFFLKEVELLDDYLFRLLSQYCTMWHLEAHPHYLIERNLLVTIYSLKLWLIVLNRSLMLQFASFPSFCAIVSLSFLY